MLTVNEALERILARVPVLPSEWLPISQALFRTAAEDVFSGRALPPSDVSQMDGYAVHAADLTTASDAAPARLRVTSRIDAGHAPTARVARGEAARIMTGAAVPEGADCVVMQEHTRAEDRDVLVLSPAEPGNFIRPRGAEIGVGDRALARGTLLGPAQLALLAALGRSQLTVHQRPRVAILTTGDELCEVDEPPGGRIVDSNGWALAAQVEAAGGIPVRLGIARDDPEAISRALDGASACDLVLTSAGVSVGERDFVRDVLAARGVELDFWRVAMKPGKPLAFGVRDGQPCFALPGNPTSSMVSFEQFVRPSLLKMQGRTRLTRPRLRATLRGPLANPQGLAWFVRASTRIEDGRLVTEPVPRQDSGLITSMAAANSLIVLAPEAQRFADGDEVTVELLDAFG